MRVLLMASREIRRYMAQMFNETSRCYSVSGPLQAQLYMAYQSAQRTELALLIACIK